jgi:hypothetical protein
MAALQTRLDGIFNTTLKSWEMTMLQYLPLERDCEIRLVDIEPGVDEQELRPRIYHSTIGTPDSPQFDALHMFGDHQNTQ